MRVSTKVISPFGEFEGDAQEITEQQARELENLYENAYKLVYLVLFSQGERIYFPAEVIQKSIIIVKIL